MYVWARLARTLLSGSRRGAYRMGGESRLRFRCLPSDIDSNLHLNNARYMMLADVGRIDIFNRSGMIKLARAQGWAPMLGGLQSVFVREIKLWTRFELVSTLETWAGTQVIGRHRFVLDGNVTAAIVMTTGGVYDLANRRFVPIQDLVDRLDAEVTPRPPSEAEEIFMSSHAGLRAIAKAEGGKPTLDKEKRAG
ncbi:thioesterase family protein [Tianweitania sediminis]|uniref:Thioesterase family protein n=1 Tax=Tianweitania sediminis TaxID=1502156 RepID=A0A8J7R021_9HYPH|nr:thioesterase family protein [Tianweitania sediminis]MBP0437386.1 thioesterase family protein [Tianweitania sediminis]